MSAIVTLFLTSGLVAIFANRKRVCLTLAAVALCLAISNGYADTDMTVYGQVNISLNNIELEGKSPSEDEWQLNTNASRLGVKGSYDITDNLQAIYKIEFEVSIEAGKSSAVEGQNTFEQRNIYAGVRHNFGTLIVGKHDTPLKLAEGKVDRFNDQILGDIKYYLEGEDRLSNMVMYTSPPMEGFSIIAALIAGENATDATERNGLIDGASVSLNYKSDWLTAAIARNDDIDSQDVTRLVADFTMANVSIGFLWQKAEKTDGSANENAWLLSASQKIAVDWVLKVQYGQTDYSSNYSNNNEAQQWVIGVDRKPRKNTRLFAYLARIKRADTTASFNDTNFAVGYEIRF